MSADRVVHVVERPRENEQLRATVNEYKGSVYCHLRIYFKSDVDGAWHPTRAGVTIAAERFHELEVAVRALRKAIDETPPKRPDRIEKYARQRSSA